MPLYIKDDTTAALVSELATIRGTTKQEAVRAAVQAELDRLRPKESLVAKLERLRAEHPLPPPTGLKADKAFFDRLWGEE